MTTQFFKMKDTRDYMEALEIKKFTQEKVLKRARKSFVGDVEGAQVDYCSNNKKYCENHNKNMEML